MSAGDLAAADVALSEIARVRQRDRGIRGMQVAMFESFSKETHPFEPTFRNAGVMKVLLGIAKSDADS